mmetsp:Transcript_1844/g.5501  ORF Transcript_1844/g.5501 Transcript_1844/m.5501 type:complete len:403 (+) Transcript_1844:141-1349(+)
MEALYPTVLHRGQGHKGLSHLSGRHVVAQHPAEVLVVHPTLSTSCVLFHQILGVIEAAGLSVAGLREHPGYVLGGDLVFPVGVDHRERNADGLLGDMLPQVEGRSDEFSIIYDIVLLLSDAHRVLGDVDTGPGHPVLDVAERQQAVAVHIERHESVSEVADLALVHLARDDGERGLFQPILPPEAAQLRHQVGVEAGLRHRRAVDDPIVLEGLLRGTTVPGVPCQQPPHQVLGVGGRPRPLRTGELDDAVAHLRQDGVIAGPGERDAPREQHVQNDAAAPDIAGLVVPSGDHLRRHVVRGAHGLPEDRVRTTITSNAEVDEFQRIVLIDGALVCEDEVLGLQIPMGNVLTVHVVDGSQNLLQHNCCLGLGQAPLLEDLVEELPAIAQLHDEVCAEPVVEGLV